MNDESIISSLKKGLGEKAIEITNPAPRRIFFKVIPENLIETMKYIKDNLGFYFVSTITGIDLGEFFEIQYHMANEHASLTVKTTTPRNNPRVPSICPVIPGAILYEREIQEMFGITIENIPDPRPLLLPDDWPQGEFPLRKDWKYERPPEVIPGGK